MRILTLVGAIFASSALADTSPISPVQALFDGMREHNSEKILAQFTDNATLKRVKPDGQIQQTDIGKFATSIANHPKYLDEQLLSVNIAVEGNLASVWTPFAFYIDGTLSHCGSNHFTVVKVQESWKLLDVIDVGYEGNCEEFIHNNKKP